MSRPIEPTRLDARRGISVANETGAGVELVAGADAVGAGVGVVVDPPVVFGVGEDDGIADADPLGDAVGVALEPFEDEPPPEPFDDEFPPEPFDEELPPPVEMLGVGAEPPPPEQPINDPTAIATTKHEKTDCNRKLTTCESGRHITNLSLVS